jgi:sec-independent protein translocase protein TatA
VHLVVAEIVGWEFLLVIAVIALLFGSSQIPKLARSLGQASKEFRHGLEHGEAGESGHDEPKDDRGDAGDAGASGSGL